MLHARALHGNPFDGHTLGPAIADIERMTGIEVKRGHVDKGYRGHNHPHKFRIWITGQVRRTTATIKREMKRRAAVEPVIGHLKAEHRMDRNHLKGRQGDRANAILAAAGYNFSLLFRWLADFLRALILLLTVCSSNRHDRLNQAPREFFTDDSLATLRMPLPCPGATIQPRTGRPIAAFTLVARLIRAVTTGRGRRQRFRDPLRLRQHKGRVASAARSFQGSDYDRPNGWLAKCRLAA